MRQRAAGVAPGDDLERKFKQQLRRRNRLAVTLVLAAVLGVVAYIAVRAILKRPAAAPSEAVAAREVALVKLRKDDSAAKDEAIQTLTALVNSFPGYVEGRAELLVALAFRLDDARLEIRRLGAASDALSKKIARYKETQTPPDWTSRVNALIGELELLKKQSDPLIDRAAALDAELNSAYRGLAAEGRVAPSPDGNRAMVRAQAIYFGVKAGDQAVGLAEKYRQLTKPNDDGWAAVAYAEYAANARVAPETITQAREGIDALRKKDPSFLRTYMLSARLAILEKRFEAAQADIEAVLLLNPKHDVAQKLAAWVQELLRPEKSAATPTAP